VSDPTQCAVCGGPLSECRALPNPQVCARGSFPPSRVRLLQIPLIDTFGKSELELAVAYLVRACQVNGDQWQPIMLDQLLALRIDPLVGSWNNPFVHPNFRGLIDGKLVEAIDVVEGVPAKLKLTPESIAKLARWVIPNTQEIST
jgi:hypothetical protein